MAPIHYRGKRAPIDETEVLHQWVLREAEKQEYPAGDPSGWDSERLITELGTTYDEPVQYATFRAPKWTTIAVSGSELGKLDPYPSIGCNWLTGGKTLAGAIDRIQAGELAEDCPEFVDTILVFRQEFTDHSFGPIVIRHCEEFWPPVTLDGNHRAWAAILAARDGLDVELEVHVGHETAIEDLPFKSEDA